MADGAFELSVREGFEHEILTSVVRALRLDRRCRLRIVTGTRAQLRTTQTTLDGLSTVCRYLALHNSTFPPTQLLGSTPEEAAQISEWISLFLSGDGTSGDFKLKKLNGHLSDRVYLVGAQPTLADMVVYAAVHSDAVAFPVAQYGHFCNLLRWHDYIQASVDVTAGPPAKRKLPLFDFTPPLKLETKSEKKMDVKADKASNAKARISTATPAPRPEPNGELPATKAPTQPKDKKEKKPKEPKKTEPSIEMLDMRVGKIVSVKQHPNADSLYIEEIDLGEEKPRQVISGLVKFMSLEEMQGRLVVVCCNLKPANMRGEQSCGMVMCASNADHTQVEPLRPPDSAQLGERITFEGYEGDPMEEIKPKQKILEGLFPYLVTDGEGTAKYRDTPFSTTKGHITSSIPNGNVR